jgi:hypothetical protein
MMSGLSWHFFAAHTNHPIKILLQISIISFIIIAKKFLSSPILWITYFLDIFYNVW